jgi:predicted HAD superfamily Cof-like phosphohydrolase
MHDMMKQQEMVRDFHDRFFADGRREPTIPGDELLALRSRLLSEEANEFAQAARARDLVGMADALADVLYVVLGTATVLGIDLEPVFAEVHRSNMTKERSQGRIGKAVKGSGYSPPDVRTVLQAQGWNEAGR